MQAHSIAKKPSPQSGSFGRRCDFKGDSIIVFFNPPQSGSFGRRCDIQQSCCRLHQSAASIWLIWQKMRLGGGTKKPLAIDRLNLAHLAEDATPRTRAFPGWQSRLNLAHLAEDATRHAR